MKDIMLMISSGKGPRECEWVVGRLLNVLTKDAAKMGIKAQVLGDGEDGPSALLRLTGKGVRDFARPYLGTIRWVGQSPFRPNHKRKNWFVGVSLMPMPEAVPEYREADISYQAMKAGGPGGQHVNTTDSAVRATHVPTGLSVVAREERYQHANKRLAQMKIAALLQGRDAENAAQAQETEWQQHQSLERGNEVRIYEGPKFKLK